jgi:hypothetical protein
MIRRTRRAEAPAKRAPRRGRPRRSTPPKDVRGESPTQEERGFLFDSYWDEAFSAYFDPTLRTCCQIRY